MSGCPCLSCRWGPGGCLGKSRVGTYISQGPLVLHEEDMPLVLRKVRCISHLLQGRLVPAYYAAMTAQELADELDIAPRSVNRILEKYESVFGPLPREDGKRIIPPSDLERIKKAVEAVYKKKAPSYELAFRAQLGQVETVPASKMDMALELLSGIKKDVQDLQDRVEALMSRIEVLEKRE